MGGRPPIVVVGAHRSGTSLLVDLLSELGVFFGERLDPNREAYFFLRRNEWLLRRAGGAWDYPLPALTFLADERFRTDVLELLDGDVRSPQFVEFVGRLDFLATQGTRTDRRPWGWKDPRNAFTFELWAQLFPGARLLAIHRNGVDAAQSLYLRERAQWDDGHGVEDYLLIRPLARRPQEALRLHERLEPYLLSTRCQTLAESFRLWEEYAGRTQDLVESYDGPSLCLGFERLLSDPGAQLAEVARFCELEVEDAAIARAAARIRGGRASAFLRDEALRAFHDEVRTTPCMRRLGYDEQGAPLASG